MKRLLILSVIMAVSLLPAVAQVAEQGTKQRMEHALLRDLKLMVRDKKGRPIRNQELTVGLKGTNRTEPLDRFGNRFFKVTDDAVVVLYTARRIYEFPVRGSDSLYVVFRRNDRIASYISGMDGEMINVGYGTVSRRANTGAVSSLEMRGSGANVDLRSYLAGRAAGVSFSETGQLIIRGINSINSGIEALIVVDGVAQPSFASVNTSLPPSEVASISVLKDAASTSIYGVRGANGVVLITTKSGGKKHESR